MVAPTHAIFAALLASGVQHMATGLTYSSGWGLNVGNPGVNETWINFQYSVSDEVAVAGASRGIPSLYSFTWTEPDASRMDPKTGFCPSKISRFGNTTRCKTLRADYKEAWAKAWASLAPFIANKTYIGVFLGDENIWDGTSIANLTAVTDMIKRDWPDGIVFINEAQDVAHCNFNRLGDPIFSEGECFPETLDWFGYDYYCTIPGCKDPYTDGAGWVVQRDGMENLVYPRLPRAGQRVIPTTLGFFWKTQPFNSSIRAAMDAYCVYTADQFYQWTSNDPRVIGMFPFVWSSSETMVGLSDLPACRAKYVDIGAGIVARSARVPALRGGGRPGRTNTCPSPVDPVKYYWCEKN